MLVTVAAYRSITGDQATDTVTVSAKLEEAIDLCADALGRELVSAERTETLWPTRDGRLWPTCVPITACTSHTIDGYGLLDGIFGGMWPGETDAQDVVYTGGFVERRANPGAANALPAYIEYDIAFAAQTLAGVGSATQFPAGAVSVRLGDAAVTFGPDGARSGVDAVRWSRRTLRWRHSTQRGA